MHNQEDRGGVLQDVAPEQQLRGQARFVGDAVAGCFCRSNEAFKSEDRARAKELSLEEKQHQAEVERLDAEATARIFERCDRRRRPYAYDVDLHDLHVKEAI